MGDVGFGIPKENAKWLQNSMNLSVAVEGGTYNGGTSLLMSKFFEKVYTIEKSEKMYEIGEEKLGHIKNVKRLFGDTRSHLPDIVGYNDNILFWLDAHWSGGMTYGEEDECPLLDELGAIFSADLTNFAIMIDDARLFLAPPPLPHNYLNWPTIKDICLTVPEGFDIIVFEDVIYVVPTRINFKSFIQNVATCAWSKKSNRIDFKLKNLIKSICSFSCAR